MSAQRVSTPMTWLITGCSSGFGLALARIVQANGHNLIATSRNPGRTPDLVNEVTGKGGQWLKLNTDDPNCGQIVEGLEEQGTEIDVLVNSAGFGMSGAVESFQEEEVRRVMETNFYGPWRLMKAAVPYMRRRRRGMVVNLSSGSGMEPPNSLGIYGASKAALDVLTKALHKEMSEFGVRVLLVCLGTFNTPMVSSVHNLSQPLDPDYAGTTTEQVLKVLTTGTFKVPGDHQKAVKVIYEVVMGEGVGEGREQEMLLPLGTAALETMKGRLGHTMEVFGDICNNVKRDDLDAGGLDIATPKQA